jgi:pSer/pThr/pTyr-binding forkhead associated (FHA) protein
MPLQVAVKQDNGAVTEHLLFEGRSYNIGRSPNSDIVVSHPQVSRSHALLNADNDNNWFLNDTSSTGCFAYGKPVTSFKVNKQHTMLLGPIACELSPLPHENVVKLDSQRQWRKAQLLRYQSQLHQCTSSTSLIHLAKECLVHSLGCERASLVLFDNIDDFQIGLGYEPWMADNSFTGSRSIIKRSIEDNQVFALGNIVTDDAFNTQNSVIKYGIQAAISVPVYIQDTIVGVLYADSTTFRRYFTQTDIDFAQSLANMISLHLLFHTIEHKLSRIS